ncbi:MAG TPA: hypothetical protein VFM18_21790 [Methanosarcina sp.]|nr:hypothetical protein [Methanosarcina sp.]
MAKKVCFGKQVATDLWTNVSKFLTPIERMELSKELKRQIAEGKEDKIKQAYDIDGAFWWIKTAKGHEYWCKIHDRISGNLKEERVKAIKKAPKLMEWAKYNLFNKDYNNLIVAVNSDGFVQDIANLHFALSWRNTPQGSGYWIDLHYKMCNNKRYPIFNRINVADPNKAKDEVPIKKKPILED